MSKTLWIGLVVAGLAVAMGYGVRQQFIELPIAAVVFFLVLAALATTGDVVEVVEVEVDKPALALESRPAGQQLPVGFHPS